MACPGTKSRGGGQRHHRGEHLPPSASCPNPPPEAGLSLHAGFGGQARPGRPQPHPWRRRGDSGGTTRCCHQARPLPARARRASHAATQRLLQLSKGKRKSCRRGPWGAAPREAPFLPSEWGNQSLNGEISPGHRPRDALPSCPPAGPIAPPQIPRPPRLCQECGRLLPNREQLPRPATSPRTLPAGTAKPPLVWGRKEKASRGEAESPEHLRCLRGASAALLCHTSAQGLPRGSPVPFVQGWTAAGVLSTCTHGTCACSIATPGVAGDPKPLTRLPQTPSHV